MKDKIKLLAKNLESIGYKEEASSLLKNADEMGDDQGGWSRRMEEHSRSPQQSVPQQSVPQQNAVRQSAQPSNNLYERYIPPAPQSQWASGSQVQTRGRYTPPPPLAAWQALIPPPAITPNRSAGPLIELKNGIDYDGLTSGAKDAADILSLLAAEMGHPPLVMTSGLRDAARQANAMHDNYTDESKKRAGGGTPAEMATAGRAYLIGLYVNDVMAGKVADCFEDSNKDNAISCATAILEVTPISDHASGTAFDLRATPGVLAIAREAVRRGLISGKIGDELTNARPHLHIEDAEIGSGGLAYLSSGRAATAIV
jgi:hypothetical protein